MSLQTNLYRALREMLPEAPLLAGEVIALNADGTATVEFPGGGTQRVRGSAAVSDQVFVRAGVIEGPAPALTPVTVEE
jgi:hypothetical protein